MVKAVREEKKKVVEELTEKFKRVKGLYFTDYKGLDVASITELRRRLREQGVEYRVVKNTLARIAAKLAGLEELTEFFRGPVALAFGYEDPIVPVKIIKEFSDKHEKKLPVLKAGWIEGRVFDEREVKLLAKIPSKEKLMQDAIGALMSPMFGVVGVLQGLISGLVFTLEAIKNKKEGGN